MVIFGEDGYNLHLQFTPDLANDWKNAMFAGMLSSSELTTGSHQYLLQRVLDSMNASQLESKLWLVQTLVELKIKPKRVALLAGWFGQYIVPLMFDTFKTCEWIENFEIDYSLDYDGRVQCESHEFINDSDLVEMIVTKVCNLFKEVEDDNSQVNTQTVAEKII